MSTCISLLFQQIHYTEFSIIYVFCCFRKNFFLPQHHHKKNKSDLNKVKTKTKKTEKYQLEITWIDLYVFTKWLHFVISITFGLFLQGREVWNRSGATDFF